MSHRGAQVQAGLGASARLELVDALMSDPDGASCASRALAWLAEQGSIDQGLCAVVDPRSDRLVGLAGHGIAMPPEDAVAVSLRDRSHPLILALAANEPVELNSDTRGAERLSFPPTEGTVLLAVPLDSAPGAEIGSGLLLVGHRDRVADADAVAWAARLLSTRLAALGQQELRRQESRLRQEVERLSGILETVTDPILLTDSGGRILVANEAAESLLTAEEQMSEGRRRAVALNNMLFSAAVSDTGDAGRREILLVDPSEGHDLLFELLSTPFETDSDTGLVSILHNVTDLRRATEQIEENYRKLRAAETKTRAERDRLDLVLNSVLDPILVTDPGGSIVLMNPPAKHMFTVEDEEDEEATRRVRVNDAVFSSLISNIHAGQSLRWRGELTLTDPATGEKIPMEAISSKVPARPSQDTAVVTILHDLSEAKEKAALYEKVKRHSEELREKVKEATAELAEQNELLRRQALELEQASAMKSQFLANVSHELRTPLNAMVGYVALLEEGVYGRVNKAQQEKLERLHANCRHLASLLNDLLDLEKIEAGKMPVKLSEVELADLVDEVMSEVEPLVAVSEPEVHVEVEPGIPPLYSDRKKIKQILINFLSNALKFTPDGEVTIRAAHDPDPDHVRIAVADTGLGISEEDQKTIFEAFGQTDASYTRSQSGTGLGLSICKRLAEVLDGDIELDSELDRGSTFTLVLPRKRETE